MKNRQNTPLPVRKTSCRLEELMPLIQEQLASGHTVRFAPRGSSMRPMLRQGIDEVVLAAPPQRLKKYDLPLYQRENGQYVLHRVVRVEDGPSYTCVGDNQFALEPGVGPEQVIAVVTEFYRAGRCVSMQSMGYRLYCRLWHGTRLPRRLVLGLARRIKRSLRHRGNQGEQ
ncbi:MAG: S24/S26 family peptidase [Clostridia bacterium]|nr:S24/S26 family peptidase [Clostridia bacterium]